MKGDAAEEPDVYHSPAQVSTQERRSAGIIEHVRF